MDINKIREAIINAVDSLDNTDVKGNMIAISYEYKTFGSSNEIRIAFHHRQPNVMIAYEYYDDGRPPRKSICNEDNKIVSGDISVDQMFYEINAEFLMRGVDFGYVKKAV